MKKRHLFGLTALVGLLAVLAAAPVVHAGVGTDTISIAFARDEPNGAGCALNPSEVAGPMPSANWNNEMLNMGTDPNLIEDNNGVASASGAQVLWYSSNTWSSTGRGEENNNFTGSDHKLMTGYLDMQVSQPSVTFIQVSNLPASFGGTYDVYVIGIPGVPGRGGIYSCNAFGSNNKVPNNYSYFVASGTTDPTKGGNQGLFSGPDYVQALGEDNAFGGDDFGNYLLYPGQSGPSVTITAINLTMPSLPGYNGTQRAPIAAVQLVVD